MGLFSKKQTLVTHDGTFHADDIFACATLSLYLKNNIKIIRTRDPKIIEKGDYVFDVGGVYDPEKNRFDHHQEGGAGERENGIPYAAVGLVWKKFGKDVCGDQKVAENIDIRLIQYIDANDNAINSFELKNNLVPYTIQDLFFAFRPSFSEKKEFDKAFVKMVNLAKEILVREIKKNKDSIQIESKIIEAYHEAKDKRMIVLDGNYPYGDVLMKYDEPLYVVYPKTDFWRVECVRKEKYSFLNRKPFPESWAGKKDEELSEITGVKDAVFCHNGRFLVVAKSKEGAIMLAKKAIEN